MPEALTWVGIGLCLSQSAIFSGLNLAVFSLSRLRLESSAAAGDAAAAKVLALRKNANGTLVTILLGNVAINVLLTQLADSVMAGITAFLFSTFLITLVGEIAPQAYFSRHALRIAAALAPVLYFYRILLWPFATPIAKLLDYWVGPEGTPWFREAELRDLLRHHARSAESEVGHLEATGAINFLALDDVPVGLEGSPLEPLSVIQIPFENGRPIFPSFERTPEDPFLRKLEASGRKWVILVDESERPRFVLDAHAFLRDTLFSSDRIDWQSKCHRPLVVTSTTRTLGKVLNRLVVRPEEPGDDVIDEDLILVWTPEEKRIITGADLLGRLLRGIARVDSGQQART